MDALTKGTQIQVVDAFGDARSKRVLAEVEGGKFPAVWACSEQEWELAQGEGREPDPEPFPWPLESVRPMISA